MLLESHGECVIELPPGAERHGRSDTAPNELFTIGSKALAMQAHPEFTSALMQGKILPAILESGALSAEAELASRETFAVYARDPGAQWARALIRAFLLGKWRPPS